MVDILGTLQQGASAIGSGLSSAPGYLSTIAQQAFQPPPLPSAPNIPPPPTFTPPALPQLPQQQTQMRRRIDEQPSAPFNSFISTPSTNINMPNTMGFNRPIPSPSITRLDMPEPAKNQPSFQPIPSLPAMNKPEMAVTPTLTKPSSISLDFKTMDQTQKPPGIFENANKFVRETTQVEKIIPTWEDTFGGIADKATGKYPNTSGKQSDLTYTEQLKVWTSGDKGYTKFVAPTTQKESDNFDPKLGIDKYRTETYKAPEGFLRDVAVPFTKKLWDLPRDEPVTAAIYYSTPLINAGVPMVAGKVLQAPAAAPLLTALNNPAVSRGLDIGSKALLGATVAQQGSYVAGYDPSNPFSAPLSQKPKDVAERSVTAMVNVVPMFAFTKGLQKVPGEIDAIDSLQWKDDVKWYVNPERTPLSSRPFTHMEMIDKINAPISPNRITMSPNEPVIISEGSKFVRQPIEYSSVVSQGRLLGRISGDEHSVATQPLKNIAIINKGETLEKGGDPSIINEIASIHSHPTHFIDNKALTIPYASSPDISVGVREASEIPGMSKHYVASRSGITGFEVTKPLDLKSDMGWGELNAMKNYYQSAIDSNRKNIQNVPTWAREAQTQAQSEGRDLLSYYPLKGLSDTAEKSALQAYMAGDKARYADMLNLKSEYDQVLAKVIAKETPARVQAINALSATYGRTKPLRTLPLDVPFYMRKPKKSKPKIKMVKKPIKRGSLYKGGSGEQINNILSHSNQVKQIEMPFKAQQITGSPQQKMSTWLPEFANKSTEHSIISSQSGDLITSKDGGFEGTIHGKDIVEAIHNAEQITGKPINKSSWILSHNHPQGIAIPSCQDDWSDMNMNRVDRFNKQNNCLSPHRYGVINKDKAIIMTYPKPENYRSKEAAEKAAKNKDHDDLYYNLRQGKSLDNAFDEYSKKRGIKYETIDLDYKPLYMSRLTKKSKPKTNLKPKKKKSEINLSIKLPSIKLPTLKKLKSKK